MRTRGKCIFNWGEGKVSQKRDHKIFSIEICLKGLGSKTCVCGYSGTDVDSAQEGPLAVLRGLCGVQDLDQGQLHVQYKLLTPFATSLAPQVDTLFNIFNRR